MSRTTGNKADTQLIREWEWQLLRPKLPEHWQVFFELLLQTSIRAYDALKITTRDLRDYGVYVTTGKGINKTRKFLIIETNLYYRMQELAKAQKTIRVFPYTAAAAWAALKLAAKKACIRETITPHCIRGGAPRRTNIEILKEIKEILRKIEREGPY
jgi:integrase